jgi:hypothetical protein
MEKGNEAFLFLSHSAAFQLIREYANIRRGIAGIGNSFFLYHSKCNEVPSGLPERELYLFSNASLSKLNYPTIEQSFFPGHVGVPVLQFFCDNSGFDYYWVIEYDVRFSGDWHFFFNFFKDAKQDFLTCHIRAHADEPDWPCWSLRHPRKSIPLSERFRSFNPIYRVSNRALSFLDQSLSDGWCGHNEVVWSTLLHHNGFTIMDMGGQGRFTATGMKDNFYTESEPNSAGLLNSGSMRFRPAFWRVGPEKNKLYHPVKPLSLVMREKINREKYRRSLPVRLTRRIRKTFLPRS